MISQAQSAEKALGTFFQYDTVDAVAIRTQIWVFQRIAETARRATWIIWMAVKLVLMAFVIIPFAPVGLLMWLAAFISPRGIQGIAHSSRVVPQACGSTADQTTRNNLRLTREAESWVREMESFDRF